MTERVRLTGAGHHAPENVGMSFRFVFLPLQTDITRDWARHLAAEQPGIEIVAAEDEAQAGAAITDADAAFGRLHPQRLARARWLHSPRIAPPAGHGPYLNERRDEILRDNCRAFAEGRTLRNLVDKASWF
jgi:hypothetical protein